MRRLISTLIVTGAVAAACGVDPASTAEPARTAHPAATQAPASAAAAARATSGGSSREALIAQGKNIFETAGAISCKMCHGTDARGKALDGGNNAPNIRGVAEQKLRDALAGGAAPMQFIKLNDAEIEAVITYLGSLD